MKQLTRRIGFGLLVCLWAVQCVAGQTHRSAVTEFAEGRTVKFSTRGHAKAKGVVFTINYPQSWSAKEGERPNIVQKFVSESGLEMVMIITKTFPRSVPVTKAVIKEMLSPDSFKDGMDEGETFIRGETTKIEGEPAALWEYSSRMERAGLKMTMQVITLAFFQRQTMVQVQFQVGGLSSNATEVSKRAALFRPLFLLFMNSIVFDDKWK